MTDEQARRVRAHVVQMLRRLRPATEREMPRFRLENPWSGVMLGVYEAETKEQALDLLAQDAGYANNAEVESALPDEAERDRRHRTGVALMAVSLVVPM